MLPYLLVIYIFTVCRSFYRSHIIMVTHLPIPRYISSCISRIDTYYYYCQDIGDISTCIMLRNNKNDYKPEPVLHCTVAGSVVYDDVLTRRHKRNVGNMRLAN